MNDAAMQALGSYRGGRMLFLGLGTGLGSTLVWQKNVLPLELGDLPYGGVHHRGLCRETRAGQGISGRKVWGTKFSSAVEQTKVAFIADYVMLGGGNAKVLSQLPPGTELGHNRNAYLGGCRMWETEPGTRRPKWNVITALGATRAGLFCAFVLYFRNGGWVMVRLFRCLYVAASSGRHARRKKRNRKFASTPVPCPQRYPKAPYFIP